MDEGTLNRLLDMRASGISLNEASRTLASEGYESQFGTALTPQRLQQVLAPWENPLAAIVDDSPDFVSKARLGLAILEVGSRSSQQYTKGICAAMLKAYKQTPTQSGVRKAIENARKAGEEHKRGLRAAKRARPARKAE